MTNTPAPPAGAPGCLRLTMRGRGRAGPGSWTDRAPGRSWSNTLAFQGGDQTEAETQLVIIISDHYSGYFIVDDESEVESESPSKTTRIPIRRENSQSRIPIRRENSQSRLGLRRENSQSSLYSSPQHEAGPDRSRTLPRQSSRSRVAAGQEPRGSLRRQQSASRLTHRWAATRWFSPG